MLIFKEIEIDAIKSLVSTISYCVFKFRMVPFEIMGCACLLQAMARLPEATEGVDAEILFGKMTWNDKKIHFTPRNLPMDREPVGYEIVYYGLHIAEKEFSLYHRKAKRKNTLEIESQVVFLRSYDKPPAGTATDIRQWHRSTATCYNHGGWLRVSNRCKTDHINWQPPYAEWPHIIKEPYYLHEMNYIDRHFNAIFHHD